MPTRCQFNSGFPARVRATEGQIPNNEPILMAASIKPVIVLKYTWQWRRFRDLMTFISAPSADPFIHYVWDGGELNFMWFLHLFDIAVQIGGIYEIWEKRHDPHYKVMNNTAERKSTLKP